MSAAGTFFGTRGASQHMNVLASDDAEMREARAASCTAKMIVCGSKRPHTMLKRNPIMRMCWSTTSPFFFIFEIIIEEEISFIYHPVGSEAIFFLLTENHPFMNYAGNWNVTSNTFSIDCNSINRLDGTDIIMSIKPAVPHYAGNAFSAFLGSADKMFPTRRTPHVQEFLWHYRHGVVTHFWCAVTYKHPDPMVEAQDFLHYMKKHTLNDEYAQNVGDYNVWKGTGSGGSAIPPVDQIYGFIRFNDYLGQGKGRF